MLPGDLYHQSFAPVACRRPSSSVDFARYVTSQRWGACPGVSDACRASTRVGGASGRHRHGQVLPAPPHGGLRSEALVQREVLLPATSNPAIFGISDSTVVPLR